MAKLLNFRFPEGYFFLFWQYWTEKILYFFSVSEWLRWAVEGWTKLTYLVTINPYQPKVFGVKFYLRGIEKIFSIEVRNFELCKMPKLFNFWFPGGVIIFELWQYWTEKIL